MTITHRSLPIALVLLLILGNIPALGDDSPPPWDRSAETEWIRQHFRPQHPAPNPRPDLRGDWAAMIDAAWGPGMDPQDQITIFNSWLNNLDDRFALFFNRDVDIVSQYEPYLDELAAGVSKGRLQGMLSSLSRTVQNAHTGFANTEVVTTQPAPGVPLLVGLKYRYYDHFGACLTTDENGEAFVYDVIDNHPLGLEVGDVVLGYDGRPWDEILPELWAAELPISGGWLTSDASFDYSWDVSVGHNWHLFATIDIRKYVSGEVVSLPTSLLAESTQDLTVLCNDQINPGLEIPDTPAWLTQDVVEVGGKRIGFIWCDAWIEDVEAAFSQACQDMVDDSTLDGLIIDFRNNMGGNMYLSNAGLAYLFNSLVPTVNFGQRSQVNDHLAMIRPSPFYYYNINGNPTSYFGKPIAVLLGPRCVSSGDQVALRMTYHPMVRTFGRQNSCSFDSPVSYSVTGFDQFSGRFSRYDAGPYNDPYQYHSYLGFPIDQEVWLTAEDVRRGRDTVVDAALAWICPEISPAPGDAEPAGILGVAPNPANPRCHIRFSLPAAGACQVEIYDLAGHRIFTREWSHLEAGPHQFSWDGKTGAGREAASGTYLVRMKGTNIEDEGRLTLVR